MRWRRFKGLKGVVSAWTYLLRVTSRGFFGELSVGVARFGTNLGRRVRLAARMFSPRFPLARRKPMESAAARPARKSALSKAPLAPGASLRPPVRRTPGARPPSAPPPR